MLYYTVVFFTVAMVAAFLWFTGIANSPVAAKILFIAFLVLAVASLLMTSRRVSPWK